MHFKVAVRNFHDFGDSLTDVIVVTISVYYRIGIIRLSGYKCLSGRFLQLHKTSHLVTSVSSAWLRPG